MKVNIYDSEYIVRANESPEYVEKLAALVDKKMRHISKASSNMPISKLAVLTALNLADELCKLHQDHDTILKLIEEAK